MPGVDRELLRQIGHLIRPLAARVANTISRGVVKLVDDSNGMQRLQVLGLANEVIEGTGGTEHPQPYGFFSVPFPDAQTFLIFPNGDRSHPIAIVVADPRYRPSNGQPGECGLRTDEGDEIRLGRGHIVTVSTTGTLKLGSSSAADGAIKGTTRNTGEQTFLTALDTFAAAIVPTTGAPAAAIAAFRAAVTVFKATAAAAVSTKVKLE